MKNILWKLYVVAGISCVFLLSNATKVCQADENSVGPDERLQRLERRINEMAEIQAQMARQVGALQSRQQPVMNQPRVPQGRQERMPSMGPEEMQPSMPQTKWPLQGEGRLRHDVHGAMRLVGLVWILCNILLATWMFIDIRKRGEGSGIFIALAVVAGIPAAIIYSLVRIGDRAFAAGK